MSGRVASVQITLPSGALGGWPVLVGALRTAGDKTGLHMVFDGLIDQIERQTNLKPVEPTGLGAVVRDREGTVWVSMRPGRFRQCSGERAGRFASYDYIDAVEVLSEGVIA